ncbi:oxidoreductase [Macrococcus hajekii]|nr:SDR family NAD(P)-dependent oxidoreductase [Macrococcus hajekii]GGB05217.1 oxidoreductase [Macrococcus hajekii]
MIGKKYILTGGTGGLGQSLVNELVARGAAVLVLGRNHERLESLEQLYPDYVTVKVLDMNDQRAIQQFTAQLKESYDGIINNAGFGYFKSLADHSDEELIQMMNVNFTHTALLMKNVIPHLRSGASIINISSQSARVTTPYGAVYAASKAALLSLTNSIRLEHPEFHVMSVNTGPIATDFFKHADQSGYYAQATAKIQLDRFVLASQIIEGLLQKKLEVNSPGWMHYGLTLYQLAPRQIEKLLKPFFLSKHR